MIIVTKLEKNKYEIFCNIHLTSKISNKADLKLFADKLLEFSEKPKTESLSSYHSEDFFGRNDDYEEPLPLT